MTATRVEEGTKFAALAAEAVRCVVALGAWHPSNPALDTAMVLLEPVVEVGTGPVADLLAQHAADRPQVGAMTVHRHPVRPKAYVCPSRAEEGLRRPHVPVLAQHRVVQVAFPVDRPVQVGTALVDLQVGPIDILAAAAACVVPALAQRVPGHRKQLHLAVPNGLMTYPDAAQRQDLAQIPERQPAAQPAERHEGDEVAGRQVRFSTPLLRLLNCRP